MDKVPLPGSCWTLLTQLPWADRKTDTWRQELTQGSEGCCGGDQENKPVYLLNTFFIKDPTMCRLGFMLKTAYGTSPRSHCAILCLWGSLVPHRRQGNLEEAEVVLMAVLGFGGQARGRL